MRRGAYGGDGTDGWLRPKAVIRGVSASLRRLRLLECDCAVYQRVHRKQRQQCAACEPLKRPQLPNLLRQARQQSDHPAEKAERSTNAGNHCPLLTYRHGTPPWILLPSVIRNCEEDLVANGEPVCAPSLAGSREGPPRASSGNDRSVSKADIQTKGLLEIGL